MRAKAKELSQEDNAFNALEAVTTTSSENYKGDATYEQYKDMHTDVSEGERNFLRTLIHFQTSAVEIANPSQRPEGNGKGLRSVLS